MKHQAGERQATFKDTWRQVIPRRSVLRGGVGLAALAANPFILSSQTTLAKTVQRLTPTTTYISYRKSLRNIGESHVGKEIPSFPHGFASTPKTLKAAVKAMNAPDASAGHIPAEGHYYGSHHDWTDDCQGVASDGTYWYISSNSTSNDRHARAIYKLTLNMQLVAIHMLHPEVAGDKEYHIGAIDYYDGIIYVAIQNPHKVALIPVDRFGDQSATRYMHVADDDGNILPWCAINPWNGYLYTSTFETTRDIFCFDIKGSPDGKLRRNTKGTITLSQPIDKVQGGSFSKNGHLFLSSDASDDVRCYSALNGAFIGSTPIQKEGPTYLEGVKLDGGQEIEGLTVFEDLTNGVPTQVHVILVDIHWAKHDDVYFKHYSYPHPEYL